MVAALVKHSGPPRSRRHGIAAIEFVMWLPLMMFLFWMTLASGHIFLVNCEVSAEVRQKAWMGRDMPWHVQIPGVTEGPLPDLAGAGRRLAELSPVIACYFRDNSSLRQDWQPRRGLLTAMHEKTIPVMLDLFMDLKTARDTHAVLGGVWDCRELSFENVAQRGKHPRLVPPKKFLYYTRPMRFVDLSAWTDLIDMGTDGLAQQAESARNAFDQFSRRHSDQLRRRREVVERAIGQTKQRIVELTQRLSQLLSALPPDQEAIDRLRGQIQAEQQRLKQLEEAKDNLDRGGGVL